MGRFINKNNILSLSEDKKIILSDDDSITDDAISFAYKNGVNVYRLEHIKHKSVERVVVTVIGTDSTGIIAGATTICKDNSINILDISQTVLHGDIFTMAMVVDIKNASVELENFKEQLLDFAKDKNLQINLEHEDLFNFMHRI